MCNYQEMNVTNAEEDDEYKLTPTTSPYSSQPTAVFHQTISVSIRRLSRNIYIKVLIYKEKVQ